MGGQLTDILLSLGTVLGATGGAWAGLKVSLNGTQKRVEKIERVTDQTNEVVHKMNTRLGILEVKHEFTRAELKELKCKWGEPSDG